MSLRLALLSVAFFAVKAHSSDLEIDAPYKPRVFILTDIENEPDDAQSLVRFLTYSNQWDTEGIVATTSIHMQKNIATWRIKEILDAYEKVEDNLSVHESGFPKANHLRTLVKEGLPKYGMAAVGPGKDSSGSDWLIKMADKPDPRPLWVTVWGGPNVLAQALWKVKNTRTDAEVRDFVAKLRVYTISDQDDSGPWIRKTFPDLFYVASPGAHSGGAYHHAIWSGISGDKFWARFTGADYSIVDNPWLDKHVRAKGPLGAQYPHTKYLMEGDTPSFFNLINNGLSNPEKPNWGGWGGRYEYYLPRTQKWFIEPETSPMWADAVDEVLGFDGNWHTTNKATIWRWRSAYQRDFAARMDWTITDKYEDANHPPVPALAHAQYLEAKPGETVNLSAEGSTDPDGDDLTYHWIYYQEAGTLTTARPRTGAPLKIKDADTANASFTVPTRRTMPPGTGTMHFILAVTDNGSPNITRYKRVIVDVKK